MNKYTGKNDKRPEFMCGHNNPGNGLAWPLEILLIVAMMVIYIFFQMVFAYILFMFFPFTLGDSIDTYTVISNFGYIPSILFIILVGGLVISKRKPASFGIVRQGGFKSFFEGLGIGAVAVALVMLVCILTGSIKFVSLSENINWSVWGMVIFSFVFQTFGDEIMLRGYIIPQFSRRYPLAAAVIVSALMSFSYCIFGWNLSVIAYINIALFSLFVSLYFLHTENIWGAFAFHFAWNIVMGCVFGASLSGNVFDNSMMVLQTVPGRELVNGGSYGPEGGLVVTVILVIMIIIGIVRNRRRKGSELSKINGEYGSV